MRFGPQKKYIKSRNVCQVTFTLPPAAAPNAREVCIAGDFNHWNPKGYELKRRRNGDYQIMLELETHRQYQYRFLIDGWRWENDWNADAYIRSPYGDSDNSIVVT